MSGPNWRLGSACVSRAGDGVLAVANFLTALQLGSARSEMRFRAEGKSVAAGRRNQHARRVRSPDKQLDYDL